MGKKPPRRPRGEEKVPTKSAAGNFRWKKFGKLSYAADAVLPPSDSFVARPVTDSSPISIPFSVPFFPFSRGRGDALSSSPLIFIKHLVAKRIPLLPILPLRGKRPGGGRRGLAEKPAPFLSYNLGGGFAAVTS